MTPGSDRGVADAVVSSPPYFSTMPLRCAKCGHLWTDYVANNCTFTVAIASMRDIAKRGCPSCGATVLIVRSTPPEATANSENC
jgi:predicted RNA-binding Zn-ribbon protein involved in translation (DUF1610 family)